MTDIGGVFPSLAGLAWSVIKAPTFQTRIQRAASGRELRAMDYPFPLWQFTLVYDFLRDNPSAGFNELRKLMGLYMLCQGAFGTFLYSDPTDNAIVGQPLQPAISSGQFATLFVGGSGYFVNDILTLVGGTLSGVGGRPMKVVVTSVDGFGGITGLAITDGGSYRVVPGLTGLGLADGSGSGGQVNVQWLTTVQLVRTLGDPLLFNGGFIEPITAPANISAMYFNTAPQDLTRSTLDFNTGILTLPVPFYTSRVASFDIAAVGLGYAPGNIIQAQGGVGDEAAEWVVTSTGTGGTITGLNLRQTGSYTVVPGTTNITTAPGSGAKVDVVWAAEPAITMDFTYYFRCRFVDDSYSFENFVNRLWQLKKLTFISVRP